MNEPVDSDVPGPSSMSDVLYLIAAHQADIDADLVRELNHVYLSYLRGDMEGGLKRVSAVADELDPALPAYDDVRALRLFLLDMVRTCPSVWTARSARPAPAPSASYNVVSLCVSSNDDWYAGRLFKGLQANHTAVQQAKAAAATWRLYSGTLLAKKLSDLHVCDQAARVVASLRRLVDSSGLCAFGAVPEALRSLLLLQSGQYAKAIESASAAVGLAEQRSTVVGIHLATSVSATAHLALGDHSEAAACLESYHSYPDCYAMPDSKARAAYVQIALTASRDGPRAAADRIRAHWDQLGTDSATFVEDVTRPAWMISIAERAGDPMLADEALAAIERLAANNPGVASLEAAAGFARSAAEGEELELPSILEAGDRLRTPRRSVSARPAYGLREPSRIPSLSRREDEIARLVGGGLTNIQVANKLGVSPHTVNFHLRNIFRKLSVSSRVKLSRIVAEADRRPPPFR